MVPLGPPLPCAYLFFDFGAQSAGFSRSWSLTLAEPRDPSNRAHGGDRQPGRLLLLVGNGGIVGGNADRQSGAADPASAAGWQLSPRRVNLRRKEIKEGTKMMRALLLLLSCPADYEAIRNLTHGAFMAGLLNMSVLCSIGAAFALRRSRLVRG